MKIKVAVLSALMLCLILLGFDSFIYFTLNRHLLDVEQSLLSNKAQTIAQYYVSHVNDDESQAAPYVWLKKYADDGQTVILLDAAGHQLAHSGTLTATEATRNFRPSTGLVQQTYKSEHTMFLTTEVPAIDQDRHSTAGYVLLVSNLDSVREYMDTLLAVLIIGSIGAVTLAALGSYLVSATVVRPITQLIRLIEGIQANRLNERVQVPKGRDEVARLAATFNSMLVRIERSFEQQARFVADASHEFRTPLTTIQGYADLLRRWGKDDPNVVNKAIEVIHTEAERLRNLANDLLTLASLEAASNDLPQRTQTGAVINEVIESLAPLHPHVAITKNFQPAQEVVIAPAHLKQIVTNLVDNALKHTPAGGRIEVSIVDTPPFVTLAVKDTGHGIPAEDLPFIFERFYRVDKARGRRAGGTGLGLAIVKGLVDLYQGTIEVESKLGQGTTVTIRLPHGTLA